MNKTKFKSKIFILFILAIILSVQFVIAQSPINLGTAANFSVLAGSGITNTGPSILDGDIGSFSTATITGFPPGIVNGTNHAGDAVTQEAKSNLTTAYNNASGRTPVTTVAAELGGTTKTAGTYNSSDGTFAITGNLTLDAQGDSNAVFIFNITSTLITASLSNVFLVNGTRADNVFWIVGSSATLGTYSTFKGNILAFTSITLTTGANVEGRVLAQNGAVTLDTNNVSLPANSIPPAISIVYPQNITYNVNVSALNYTVSDTNLQSCWYSLNLGLTNTSITCGTNASGLTSVEGSNTWTVYANDSVNNINSSTIVFTVDRTAPSINITYPLNTTYGTAITTLNYTVTGSPQSCWFTNNSGLTNNTITCGTNFTGLNSSEGTNTWRVYANDSAGNVNFSSITFTQDTISPLISITSPQNATYNNRTQLVNISATGTQAIWFINSSGQNVTYTTPINQLFNEGSNTLVVFANDSAGNVNSTNVTFITDSSAPVFNTLELTKTSSSAAISFNASESVNATLNYGINASVVNSMNVSSFSNTGSFSLTGLSASTLYFYNLTICDAASNCITNGTNNFTTDAVPAEAAPSSGGGTGASLTGYATYIISDIQLMAGFTQNFAVGGGIEFKVGGQSHTGKIISLTADSVTIEVMSEPQNIILKIGQEAKFDVNSDGIYDLSVKLNSIDVEKKTANVFFSSIIENPGAKAEPVIVPKNQTLVSSGNMPSPPEDAIPAGEIKQAAGIGVLARIVASIIIAAIGFLIVLLIPSLRRRIFGKSK